MPSYLIYILFWESPHVSLFETLAGRLLPDENLYEIQSRIDFSLVIVVVCSRFGTKRHVGVAVGKDRAFFSSNFKQFRQPLRNLRPQIEMPLLPLHVYPHVYLTNYNHVLKKNIPSKLRHAARLVK